MCATEGWESYGQWSLTGGGFKAEMATEISRLRDHPGEFRHARRVVFNVIKVYLPYESYNVGCCSWYLRAQFARAGS